jgi:hypothetical protein
MSITFIPDADTSSLRVTGDIETKLTIPADPSFEFGGESYRHAYYIALSDGSLIKAVRHIDPNWDVIIEGAGTIEVAPDGKTLTVHWSMEWMTLATNCNASAVAHKSTRNLPLFHPELGSVNAIG